MKNKDPRDFGFFMPGEWHDHEATWMAWPARVDLWPNVEATKQSYADVANAMSSNCQAGAFTAPLIRHVIRLRLS